MWILLVSTLVLIGWFLIEPLVVEGLGLTFYIRLFLVTFLVSTFAQLRLYNSIVQNTRFAIKLRDALLKFVGVSPSLERAMKNLNSTLGNVKASTDSVRKTIDNTNDIIEKATEVAKNKK